MFSLRNVVVAVALVAAQGCNKSDSQKHADKAADTLTDKQDDLRDMRKDLGDKKVDEVEKSVDITKKANQVADAKADYDTRREIRYRALEAQLGVIATQPVLISSMANAFPLTEKGRANVTDKLQKLQMRLDEAKNQINLVRVSLPDHFKDADDKATDAMGRLDDARKDAWDALDKAPRTDRSS